MRIAVVLAVVGAAAAVALAVPHHAAGAPSVAACGEERWDIKTAKDVDTSKINFTAKTTTVRAMRRRNKPSLIFEDRRSTPVELQAYTIDAELVWAATEKDGDIHLVITDADHPSATQTMIVELPSSSCTVGAFARATLTVARQDFEQACGRPSRSGWSLDGRATITGVGFWDFFHHQHGVAPNAIELHPVTGFHAVRCVRQP